jgi:hypothetical protein
MHALPRREDRLGVLKQLKNTEMTEVPNMTHLVRAGLVSRLMDFYQTIVNVAFAYNLCDNM